MNKNSIDTWSIRRLGVLKIVFSIFLILNVIPFFVRIKYEIITKINYSLTLLVLLSLLTTPKNINNKFILFVLVSFSILLISLGNSGSIFALIVCSILPILLFDNFRSFKGLSDFFFTPFIIAALLSIIGVLFIFSHTYDILTELYFLGEYFLIASINYVPLTLFNIAIALYLLLKLKKESKNLVFFKIVLLVLTILCVVASFIYLTKTTFFGSTLLLFFQLKRKHIYFLSGVIVFFIFKYHNLILDGFVAFMGVDLSEVTMKDDRRLESAILLVNDAINLKYNYRDTQSFSTLLNLLFSIFPISLLMIFPLISVVRKFRIKLIDQYSLFGVLILLTSYQMDFLSLFTLYFIVMFISHFNKYSI